MANYDDVGSGAVGINWAKAKPTDPDYRGRFELYGKNYSVAAWKKFRKDDGREFFSFIISEVTEGPARAVTKSKSPPVTKQGNMLDDDIPF